MPFAFAHQIWFAFTCKKRKARRARARFFCCFVVVQCKKRAVALSSRASFSRKLLQATSVKGKDKSIISIGMRQIARLVLLRGDLLCTQNKCNKIVLYKARNELKFSALVLVFSANQLKFCTDKKLANQTRRLFDAFGVLG